MTPQVTIITPTYNKPTYFSQCAESVLAQTYQDWVWWVVFNFEAGLDLDLRQQYVDAKVAIAIEDKRVLPIDCTIARGGRAKSHIPAQIVNWLYPKVQTPYIYFLADDDLIDKDGLEVLMRLTRYDRDWDEHTPDALYGRCEVQSEQQLPNLHLTYKTSCWCFDGQDVGLGTGIDPDCRLDGGQVLHTKALWDRATADGWQLPTDKASAGHNDGQLLSRLAQFATFHYVPQRICIHRRTHLSEMHKPQVSQ